VRVGHACEPAHAHEPVQEDLEVLQPKRPSAQSRRTVTDDG
jgi:hypothetical protein